LLAVRSTNGESNHPAEHGIQLDVVMVTALAFSTAFLRPFVLPALPPKGVET
jgi:hypothetical protein